ncbi:MAG: flagellar basal-body MS-ring/collar protein FliF [Alphaproteobacteria bacterium]
MSAVIQIFRGMGPVKLSIIGGTVLFFIIGAVLLSVKSSVKNYVPLYSNLDIKDSNKIVAELESKDIPFQLKLNGSEILVPEDKVLRLRMGMAQLGIPSHGSIVGYEIFDNSELLGTSNFVQNVNLVRALEGELGRTISSFSNIASARVHLVIPKKEIFTREKQVPSASVIIGMKSSNTLGKDQINAISNLVATAVPELDIAKITIVDTNGRSLKIGSKNSDDLSYIVSNNEEFRIAYENRLKNTIEELIEQSVGLGHVKAQISADMNFDRIVTNSEIYDPSGQVVRSIQEIDDKESSNDKESDNNVSVTTNMPNAQGGNGEAGNQSSANSSHNDTTTNYEISKTIKNQISETGTVKKISIAVIIDGNYKVDSSTGEVTYSPRSEEELQKYNNLIRSAVGFDEARGDKIEVANMQFTTDLNILKPESNVEWFKRELPNLLQTLIIGAVVVLVLLLVIRPIAIRAFEATKVDLEEISNESATISLVESKPENLEVETPGEQMINIAQIEARFKANAGFKSINDVVGKYPQETVSALRKWMNKE